NRAGLHDPGIQPAQAMRPAERRVDPARCLAAKTRAELGATGMRRLADLDDGGTDREAAARGKGLLAEVKVHVELVARVPTSVAPGVLGPKCADVSVTDREPAVEGTDAGGCGRTSGSLSVR